MKLRSRLFYSYLFFLAVYSAFILLPTPSPAVLAQYHVSTLALRTIDFTIIVLQAGIWFIGFYGYAQLASYTALIKRSKEGKHIAHLTQGILLVVLWLPVSSVISAVLNYVAVKNPGLLPTVQVINIYVNLLLPLIGFLIIAKGARGLSELAKQRPSFRAINILIILVIYIGLVYYRLVATTANREAVYHMSIWFILATVVAPYIFMWFTGLTAAMQVYAYTQKVAGIVYRKSWNLVSFGLCWLILVSIGFQYLTTLSARFTHFSIYSLLAIVYALLLVLSVGFVLIALGARGLKKIEEV